MQLASSPPQIDNKLVGVAYAKPSQTAKPGQGEGGGGAALAAAQWTNNTEELLKAKRALAGTNYSEAEIEQLAEYSASTYAKTPEEKAYYLQYYRDFYRQVEWKCLKTSKRNYLSAYNLHGNWIYRNGGKLDSGTGPEALASAAEAPTKPISAEAGASNTVTVEGVEYKRYPTPDVSTYTYDETSGYYYDAVTTFYYDANSQVSATALVFWFCFWP